MGNKDRVPNAILPVEFVSGLRGLLQPVVFGKSTRYYPALLQISTTGDHRICLVKMRDSDMFQNVVDIASLQQEPPFQVCLPKLSRELLQTHFGLRLNALAAFHGCHMRLTPIYIAFCRVGTLVDFVPARASRLEQSRFQGQGRRIFGLDGPIVRFWSAR